MSTLETTRIRFNEYIRKMKSYDETLGLLYWDLRTGAPKKGVEQRSETIGMLSSELFRLSTSEQMRQFIEELSDPDASQKLNQVELKLLKESKKDYEHSKKIPPELYREFVVLASQSESVWEEAKEKSDFSLFQPYLEKIVKYTRQFIDLWGYEGNKYNTLLDQYEPGMTVEKLDQVFGALRDKTVPLLAELEAKGKSTDNAFLYEQFDLNQQRALSRFMLQQIGFDFASGRLDESVHPFATGLSPGDVRVTTMYRTHDITSSLFSSLHEGGHALYEQNIGERLIGTTLCTGTSMGIHESQSRMWENMIGRSRAFLSHYYDNIKQILPGKFSDVDVERFYLGVNQVKPSLIRIDADELTYNLHIMVRYELEKALMNDQLAVADLPGAWKQKYSEYLNVTPKNDAEGVLQDVHWSDGSFGYFPSYALGNMYSAQFMNTMNKKLGDVEQLIRSGRLLEIKQWLSDQIYQYGKLLDPDEIIRQVTGEDLNPDYLVEYLEAKYKDVYGL